MNPESISVIGNNTFDYDSTAVVSLCAVITSGNTNKFSGCQYAVTTLDSRIQDLLNSKSFNETKILTTPNLHKKYVFFDRIDELPYFPFLKGQQDSFDSYSEQLLSLLLGIWLEYKKIYLFGYDIEDLEERANLINVIVNHPHTEIVYVRKPNPNKIFLFDSYENMSVIDYKEFDEIVNDRTKQ